MKTGNPPFRDPGEKKPMDVLREFVGVFMSKGWLNRELRIKHRDRRYRIFCSERKFFVYRINDNCGVSWGFPGWPECIVTHEHIIDASARDACESTGPSAEDWLRCIAGDDFEII
jgi:hypothetical protein